MKIAISGTHFAGKTSLGHALIERLAGFVFVDEPYLQLVRDGHEFSDIPTTDDFAEQMQVSVSGMVRIGTDTIFDRSPLDFLAYALSLKERDEVDVVDWVQTAKDGLSHLDLLVFCPLEVPDRIQVPQSEDRRLRTAVDRRLKDMVLDDCYGILSEVAVLEARGTLEERIRQVMAEIRRLQDGSAEVT